MTQSMHPGNACPIYPPPPSLADTTPTSAQNTSIRRMCWTETQTWNDENEAEDFLSKDRKGFPQIH
jgi:hypothetical protein